MFSGTAQVSRQVCQFFLSLLCVFLRMWLWLIKTRLSCAVASLLFILEGWVPWDVAIVVPAGKVRKLWDSLSELRSSVCERRLERTVLRSALLPLKTAQFTQFFPSGVTSHSKIAQFNWECIAHLTQNVRFRYLKRHDLDIFNRRHACCVWCMHDVSCFIIMS
jgi:hypothetical protein